LRIFEPNNTNIRLMRYNWQQKDWPQFKYDLSAISPKLSLFSEKVGKIRGLLEGLTEGIQLETIVEAMDTRNSCAIGNRTCLL